MVVRSEPSLRRSSRRGEPDTPPVKPSQPPSSAILTQRAKRARISSLSESADIVKRQKTEKHDKPLRLKFPLRSRQQIVSVSRTRQLSNGDQTATAAQPTGTEKGPLPAEKRMLRSHDGGSRSKSELSNYFTNYEQMISLESAKPDFLNAKTSILLIDDLHNSVPLNLSPALQTDPFAANKPLHQAHRVDLAALTLSRRAIRDTLPEEVYSKAHRKAERHEKQLRNIEKERAQHENVQLHRLLEELKGPDWLKVMGISGVTESEKKLYEPKRIYFVREVAALIAKFRHWKEEEKRRKQEREQTTLVDMDEESGSESGEEVQEDEIADSEDDGEDENGHPEETDGEEDGHLHKQSFRSPTSIFPVGRHGPDTSEVDAAAARQLHQEVIGAAPTQRRRARAPSNSKFSHQQGYPPNSDLVVMPEQAAPPTLNQPRGRNFAFGQPLPSPKERDFQLPEHVLTRQTILARARERRRLRRGVSEQADD